MKRTACFALWGGLLGTAWLAARADMTWHNVAAGNFAQDWTNSSLITADDNWSGVPCIEGYRGDGLTSANDVDPQTVLAAGTTPSDVNANQSDPNVLATGGVTEFDGIADPAVALMGSGTADAPFLLLRLDCAGVSNILVSYDLRDLDGSTDDAVSQVACQYRVGDGGDFVNLATGYVADATTGSNQATRVTPVRVVLPPEANGQTQVCVRIITSNAAGNDEWVGVDNIRVSVLPTAESFGPSDTPGQFEFNCLMQSGSTYQVEGSTNLVDWAGVGDAMPGGGEVKTLVVQSNAPAAFWRLRMNY